MTKSTKFEILRLILKQYLAKRELEQDQPIIKKFMEKFGYKWRKLGES